MNQALVLISPIVLVRLLPVEDFGRYREFLLYVAVLVSVAAFGINSSLLRFIPDRPDLKWSFVSQTVLMTSVSSALVAASALFADAVAGGRLMGEFAVPAVLYMMLFVNLDFWEFLWLSERRTFAVLGYTTGRLVARMVIVITSAVLTKNVMSIIWSLVCFETLRLIISGIGWRTGAKAVGSSGRSMWREQLQYCLPFGAALVLTTVNKSMGSLLVAKMLGTAALAQYAIGVYVEPVIAILRNSLSDVLLPEMVLRNQKSQSDRLQLWRRSTVLTAILLVAAGVVLVRFAEILVITLFSDQYRAAIVIMQIYTLVFLRESLDFGIPLRAINRTVPILRSNVLAISINIGLLIVLLPLWGLTGAVASFVFSRLIEGAYLGWETMRAYDISLSALAPWKDLLKVVAAAGLAAAVLYGGFWTEYLGLVGVILGGMAYLMVFFLLLTVLRVPEAALLLQFVRSAPALALRRPQ